MMVCGHENRLIEGVLYYTTKMKSESEINNMNIKQQFESNIK